MLENVLNSTGHASRRAGPVQRLLRTRAVWRLSGLNYWSACMATKGRLMTRHALLAHCRQEMQLIRSVFREDDVVVEFGCGLGGNMIANAGSVQEIVGIDINPYYLRHARRLSRSYPNCRFELYEGGELPFADASVDVVYSWAVFERIPKPAVAAYLQEFIRILKPRGRSAVYLLRPAAKDTGFTRLLGEDAYVYFDREEAEALMANSGFAIERFVDWPTAHVCLAEKRDA
tara:strand:+ start:2989 stop:3681 length:693 start_codon:yes stop_codon:yes gene_type:complete